MIIGCCQGMCSVYLSDLDHNFTLNLAAENSVKILIRRYVLLLILKQYLNLKKTKI